ncbi:MAG: hypothetical protein HY716_10850 [Planctomycetes bacterium]|nr:hypothetical protein [Planctomycetota bacterium]
MSTVRWIAGVALILAGAAAISALLAGKGAQKAAVASSETASEPSSEAVGVPVSQPAAEEKDRLSSFLESPKGQYETWRALERERDQRMAEARDLETAAHQALDRGDYATAVEAHRKAKTRRAELEELNEAMARVFPETIRELLRDMESDAPIRDLAKLRLVADVGAQALPELEKLVRLGDDARKLIHLINTLEVGIDGLYRQWAIEAVASSEAGAPGCSAEQACGKPGAPNRGCNKKGWAPQPTNAGEEWIALTYELPVRPVRVRIHKTGNPGAVIKVEAFAHGDNWTVLWSGIDPTKMCPGWFEVDCASPEFSTRSIRITLDTSKAKGRCKIGAVELIGQLPTDAQGKP